MNTLIIAIFGLVTVIIAVVVFGAMRATRASTAELIALAESHGWDYSGASGLTVYRISGTTDGVTWTLEALEQRARGSQSRGRTYTRWRSAQEPGGVVVLAGPKLPGLLVRGALGGSIVQAVMKLVLGDDAAQLEGVDIVDLGDTPLANSIDLVSSDADAAREWIEPVAADLVAWPGGKPPVIVRWKDEVYLRVDGPERDADVLQAMVGVGCALVR